MSTRSISRRSVGRRSRDTAVALAESLLIRALRRAGAQHVLLGQPGMIGFVVEEADVDAFTIAGRRLLFRDLSADFHDESEVIQWKSGPRNSDEASLKKIVSTNSRIFGFACRDADIPSQFRLIADGVVSVDSVDIPALRGAFQALLGCVPPERELATVLGTPLHLLGAAMKPGRNMGWVLRRLRSYKAAATKPTPKDLPSGPSLSDLHGLDEAATWGFALAADLADYTAGRIPWSDVDKGVVISGPPGTGKTTYAQAVARTCGVPIHLHSLARWQAKGYLNDLLKAMRNAFEEAKKNAPCILFLDELDSFGDRERLEGRNEHYSREVINGFLECLDGAETREGVIVIGATNLPHKIDAAILRPGRLDRHVRIPLPDLKARSGILRYHLREALPNVELEDIAARVEGASGALIEQIVRDARRRARVERRELTLADLSECLPERVQLAEAAYRRACVHEAGHAVVGYLLREVSGSTPIDIQTFRAVALDGSGGQTKFERNLGLEKTLPSYLAQITTILAGLAAEQLILGEHGSGGGGADNSDLHFATVIAASLEASLGLGRSLTYLCSDRPREILSQVRGNSRLKQLVDARLDSCLQKAKTILANHRTALGAVMVALIEHGRVTVDDLAREVGTDAPLLRRSDCWQAKNLAVTARVDDPRGGAREPR